MRHWESSSRTMFTYKNTRILRSKFPWVYDPKLRLQSSTRIDGFLPHCAPGLRPVCSQQGRSSVGLFSQRLALAPWHRYQCLRWGSIQPRQVRTGHGPLIYIYIYIIYIYKQPFDTELGDGAIYIHLLSTVLLASMMSLLTPS